MKIDLGSKIKRREFLVRVVEAGSGAVLAPAVLSVVGLVLPGCGESGDSGGPSVSFTTASAGDPQPQGHTHTFSIPQTILDTPPAGGYMASTSTNQGHPHTITLTQNDLRAIVMVGVIVPGDTSFDSGHSHPYNFNL